MPIKAQNLIAMIATVTGLDVDDVALHARRLREVGLFVRETRSPSSPRVTSRHVANLLTMILSERPAAYAEKVIGDAQSLAGETLTGGDLEYCAKALDGRLEIFTQEHSFLDALEALVMLAIECPSDFERQPLAKFREVLVIFDRQNFTAHIDLDFEADPVLAPGSGFRKLLSYHDESGASSRGASKYFRQENSLQAEVFAAIGECFARGALDE